MKTDYAYQPYGTASVSDTSNTNTYEYTGRELDGSGLQYNRNRFYNPAWGRFVSEDPIGFAGGINVYGYARFSPTKLDDPFGLDLGNFWFNNFLEFEDEFITGSATMWNGYQRMEARNWRNSDNYYHCMANCLATNEGKGGAAAARTVSFFRTKVYGRMTEIDWAKDDAANQCGQTGGECQMTCSQFLPVSSAGKPLFPGY